MAVNVNRVPHNMIPPEWAFHPTIGPFIRELMNVVWQTRTRTGGDADIVDAVEVQSDDTMGSAMESRIAELESLVRSLQVENAHLSRIAALESRLESLERETTFAKPEPQTDIDFTPTLIYDLIERVKAIEVQI